MIVKNSLLSDIIKQMMFVYQRFMTSEMLNILDSCYLKCNMEVYTEYFIFAYGKKWNRIWKSKTISSENIVCKIWQSHIDPWGK